MCGNLKLFLTGHSATFLRQWQKANYDIDYKIKTSKQTKTLISACLITSLHKLHRSYKILAYQSCHVKCVPESWCPRELSVYATLIRLTRGWHAAERPLGAEELPILTPPAEASGLHPPSLTGRYPHSTRFSSLHLQLAVQLRN